MPVRFTCPHCRQKLSVSSRKAGRDADCPRCGRMLTIPAAAGGADARTHSESAGPRREREAPLADEPRANVPHTVTSHESHESHDDAHDDLHLDLSAPPHDHDRHSESDRHEDFELVFDTEGDAPDRAQPIPTLI